VDDCKSSAIPGEEDVDDWRSSAIPGEEDVDDWRASAIPGESSASRPGHFLHTKETPLPI
jgi:hypothetical protein